MRNNLDRRPELSKITKKGVQAVMEEMGKVDLIISNSQHPNKAVLVGKDKEGKKVVIAVQQTGLKQTESRTFTPEELSDDTRSKLFDKD
jgi:hypothetical protein